MLWSQNCKINITLCSIQSSLPCWNSCGVNCSGLWTPKMITLILKRCEFCRACSSMLIRTDCSDLVRQFTLSEFQSAACAKNFHEGGSFSSIWWSFVFGVLSLWRHKLTSYSCFQANVLARFVDIIGTFFYTHSPYFMCHCTENKLSALKVTISEENKLNATTQQFITSKISGSTLKQGSETNSSLRRSYLQRQNQAALMSCRIRAVEYRKCAAGLAGVHPVLQDRILLNYTRIEKAHKVAYARKRSICFCTQFQKNV